ncbi:MAG: VWA domain-containing protein [Clostridia bacterium]|nr:VWA domain-containing protein [Clostridia bacterium]
MSVFSLLVPLGLLGLIGIAVLIIIYIIRPNYQQKVVSSTFVWEMSLRYKKRRLPTNKLRNILIIICQILILAIMAFILSRPVMLLKTELFEDEAIVILDASASMRTIDDNGTMRFERAINEIVDLSYDIERKGGYMSVIYAGETSEYFRKRCTAAEMDEMRADLKDIISGDTYVWGYGGSDIEGALTKSEQVLALNPEAKVYVYTDKTYGYLPEDIILANVTAPSEEWNAAILDAKATREDNFYYVSVDVACYGRAESVNIKVDVQGPNGTILQNVFSYETVQDIEDGQVLTVVFKVKSEDGEEMSDKDGVGRVYVPIDEAKRAYSFKTILVSLDVDDSLELDNSFSIYGGERPTIKIQYFSLLPNPFFQGALGAIKRYYSDIGLWNIEYKEIKQGTTDYALDGFDFYIFEHYVPEELPTDGVTFLVDPQGSPRDGGYRVVNGVNYGSRRQTLSAENIDSPLLKDINAEHLWITQMMRLADVDDSYDVILSNGNDPVFLAKNNKDEQVAILAFSLHYSNFALTNEFSLLFANILDYYFPMTITKNVFEVGEETTVNARGEFLNVSGYKMNKTIEEFPSTIKFDIVGTYTLTQTTYLGGKTVEETVYVKMPEEECDIWAQDDGLNSPYRFVEERSQINDLLLYFAIGLVALLFIEWILHLMESI